MKRKGRLASRSKRAIFIDDKGRIDGITPEVSKAIGDEAKDLVGLMLQTLLPSQQEKLQKQFRDAVQEKEVLLQELRHRITNSLQIISSLILLKARRVQSEEVRLHIQDAHLRIQALAEMTRHLTINARNDVDIISYLTQLCRTIDSSMIYGRPVTLAVSGHSDTAVSNQMAVGLGLIVTELVINSLKFAFQGDDKGAITVIFNGVGPTWKLSVEDDGVGYPADTVPGLGSKVIETLAGQLSARVEISNKSPGCRTSILYP